MGQKSDIEWTDASWTPIRARRIDPNDGTVTLGWHCEHVSDGCRNCYAEGINRRLGTKLDFKPGHLGPVEAGKVELFFDEEMLTAPLRWKKPRRIFVCSMTDLFAAFVPDEWIDRIFAVMALCPQHTFQVLTKRPERMRHYLYGDSARQRVAWADAGIVMNQVAPRWRDEPIDGRHRSLVIAAGMEWPLPNVWLGTSAEDQKTADARIPHLLATPAAIRFLSAEPLLGEMDLRKLWPNTNECRDALTGEIWRAGAGSINSERTHGCNRLDWVICGGESGRNARPMHPDWARQIRDQCAAAGVPFFFKQWGEWEVALDRERDDPDWRRDYTNDYVDSGKSKWLNLAGGCGFHGERFHVMRKVGKKAAGRLLDGIEHDGMPEVRHHG